MNVVVRYDYQIIKEVLGVNIMISASVNRVVNKLLKNYRMFNLLETAVPRGFIFPPPSFSSSTSSTTSTSTSGLLSIGWFGL